jgi:hypothetical protein
MGHKRETKKELHSASSKGKRRKTKAEGSQQLVHFPRRKEKKKNKKGRRRKREK